jgi:hypothetical protein
MNLNYLIMEFKYYTPDISEFYVGFEYERMNGPDWEKSELTNVDCWGTIARGYENEFEEIDSLIRSVRVKYLDKEDIESLGFKFTFQEYGGTASIVGSNNKERNSSEFIGIQFEDDWQYILNGPTIKLYNNDGRLFSGIIKNKSELIKLLKQIEINVKSI